VLNKDMGDIFGGMDIIIKVNIRIIIEKEKENLFGKKENIMKVNLKMIKKMDMEVYLIKMEIF
jgi:hypothetical protein